MKRTDKSATSSKSLPMNLTLRRVRQALRTTISTGAAAAIRTTQSGGCGYSCAVGVSAA